MTSNKLNINVPVDVYNQLLANTCKAICERDGFVWELVLIMNTKRATEIKEAAARHIFSFGIVPVDATVAKAKINIDSPETEYSEKYDAYFNKKTGEWLESKCGDKNCEYCGKRPKKMRVNPKTKNK